MKEADHIVISLFFLEYDGRYRLVPSGSIEQRWLRNIT